MALSGTLSTMPLPDLLQWLGVTGRTGTVSFTRGGVTKRVYIDDGVIVGSSSTDPTDILGQWLVSTGRITEVQLRAALLEQKRSKAFLGATLVGTGALSESELSRTLTLKTEEIIYGLFLWDDAMFEFADAEFTPLPFRLSLSVQDVLLKGVRRYDEIQRIREVFPHSNVVLRPLGGIPRQVREKPAARRVYEAIDGRRSISAIALHVHGSEFIVSKFLFDLHRAGRVEIVSVGRPPRKAPPPPSDAPVDATGGLTRVERLLEDGAYRGALDALAALPGDDPRARRLTEQAEGLLMDKTYRLHLPPDGVPVLARPMSEMIDQNLSAEESYLLSRIDGEWDVRSIISISPLREIDALLTLDRLREKGLIKLN